MPETTSPPTPDPDLTLDQVSNLSSQGTTPLMMTGLFVQLLRQQFASRDQITTPQLKSLLWSPENPSSMLIESITRWDPAKTGQVPGVLVKRNDWSVIRLGINDKLMGYGPIDGSDYYTVLGMGSHTLFALAPDAGQAELLGTEVYLNFLHFGPVFRKFFKLHRLVVQSVGGLFRLEEPIGTYGVPVTIAYVFQETWKITPQEPILKKVTLRSIIDTLLGM